MSPDMTLFINMYATSLRHRGGSHISGYDPGLLPCPCNFYKTRGGEVMFPDMTLVIINMQVNSIRHGGVMFSDMTLVY